MSGTGIRRPDPVQAVRPSVQVSWLPAIWLSSADFCRPVSNIDGHRHLRSAGRGQLDVPRSPVWGKFEEKFWALISPSKGFGENLISGDRTIGLGTA